MQLVHDTNIQFMKYRKYWVTFSLVLLLLSLVTVFFQKKLNLGIDFAGGTQLTLKFDQPVAVENLRDVVAGAGIEDAVIQSFGAADANEVLIKTPVAEGTEEGMRGLIVGALDRELDNLGSGLDLNRVGRDAVADLLETRDPDGLVTDGDLVDDVYGGVADAILGLRRETGLIEGWESVKALPEVTEAAAVWQEPGPRKYESPTGGHAYVLQGPDSFAGMLTSTLQGSTETTFYVLTVYCGAAGIRDVRHALPACLIGDLAGAIGATAACHFFFG